MKNTITITRPWRGKTEITAQDAIEIQHDGHSSYSMGEYIRDIMSEFDATEEEATNEVHKFFSKESVNKE